MRYERTAALNDWRLLMLQRQAQRRAGNELVTPARGHDVLKTGAQTRVRQLHRCGWKRTE
jgi:hypothetical protein